MSVVIHVNNTPLQEVEVAHETELEQVDHQVLPPENGLDPDQDPRNVEENMIVTDHPITGPPSTTITIEIIEIIAIEIDIMVATEIGIIKVMTTVVIGIGFQKSSDKNSEIRN